MLTEADKDKLYERIGFRTTDDLTDMLISILDDYTETVHNEFGLIGTALEFAESILGGKGW